MIACSLVFLGTGIFASLPGRHEEMDENGLGLEMDVEP